jgi:prevent-host-death family protein
MTRCYLVYPRPETGTSGDFVVKFVGIADARAQWSKLIALVEAGEQICITRRDKPVAKLVAKGAQHAPIDMARLQAVTAPMSKPRQSTGVFIRKMRNADRY